MGFLRLFLALCVVQAHTGNFLPWPVPNGRQAVEMFFIISGFYMGLILEGRYRTLGAFYQSRWLRIAVPFYVHLAVFVLISLFCGLLFSKWLALGAYAESPFSNNGAWGVLFTAFTNLTIIGQDWVLFLSDPAGGAFRFTTDFRVDSHPLYRYLVIPQCWTVGLELCFYLLVPLLVRLNSWYLGGLTLVLLGAKLSAYRFLGLDHDPWNYRFFPFELPLFCLGILAWRLVKALPASLDISSTFRRAPLYLILIGCVILWGVAQPFFAWRLGWHVGQPVAEIFLLLPGPLFIGILFLCTKSNAMDRALGELSYPIYLNHLFIIVFLRAWPGLENMQAWFGLLTGISSIFFAWFFWHFFLKDFEKRRHRRFGVTQTASV